MFDLFRSRQKAVRYMLMGLLTVVALSMVTYLIPGFGSGTSSSTATNDGIIAKIGNTELTAQEVSLQAQRLLQRGSLPVDAIDVYLPQLVDQMVEQRAIAYEFGKMGLTVSDDEVLVGLESANPQFFKDGVLIAKDEFTQALAQQGMTLQDVVDDMRRELMVRKVQNIVYSSILVPDKEVEDQYRQEKERASIKYIAFPPAKFRDQIKPTPEEMHAVFEGHHTEYTMPEKRSFEVLILDQAKMQDALQISDADLHAAYNASMDNFRMPDRVKAQHILIKTQGMSDAQKKEALAKAEDILKQLKAGADFSEMAKKYSQDSSAAKGGDLGWFVHGQMVPEFDKAAFALNPGQMSGIVTSEYGYHIIKVNEKENARVKPFDEARADLITELKKQRVVDLMQTTADKMHDELVKSPGSAAAIAKETGAELVTVTDATPGSPVPTLGSAPEVDSALAQIKVNQVTPELTLPSNRLVVAELTQRIPMRPATFEEVQDKVRDRVIEDKADVIAKAKAEEAAKKLRAGEDIAKVAKSFGLEVSSPADFGRSDSVEGLGQAIYVKEAFTSPVGTVIGPTSIMSRDVVYVVNGKTEPDMAAFPAEKENLRNTIRQQRANERLSLFMDSVTTKLGSEGKLKTYPAVVQKLAAQLKRS